VTLLVGVDGSPAAATALGWAGRFARPLGGRIVVANVFEPSQAELAPADYVALLDEAGRRLEGEWSRPLRGAPGPHRALQLTGGPDRLVDAAADEDAVLVVGTRGTGRSPGLHLGSLAHHLAHHVRGPLAIVPLDGATRTADRIVVGIDGSSGSAAAASWCASIAAASGAEVVAVCVSEPRSRWGLGGVAEDAVSDDWTAPLRAAGVTVRTRVVEGRHPAAELRAIAAAEAAGLLVVGAREAGGAFGRRLVRVPLQLVHLARLPVVMVPPASRHRPEPPSSLDRAVARA
jgi:nucleotide-binding universal stress UspA family protein